MSGALAGLRVLDLSTGPAVGMATMILADFGAEVILVAGKTDDPLAGVPAAPMWRRGKHTLHLDLAASADRDQLERLLAAADVFVCNWRSSALARKDLDFTAVHARHPHLIYSHVTAFGSRGPLADYPGYEHLVAAYTGRMQVFAGIVDRPGPVFSALQVGVHACAQSTAAGILAAVLARGGAGGGSKGEGRLVETSLLQGMLPYEQGAMLGVQFRERFADMFPPAMAATHEPPMPSLYYHPAQAGDGRWMQFGNLLPHLFDNFLRMTDLLELLVDPDFDPAQMLLPPPKHEAFRAHMLGRIQERTAAEWMADFIADGGVVATAYQTTQQALSDPDIVANGHAIERAEGGVQLGPLARLTATPAQPGPPALDAAALAEQWAASPRSSGGAASEQTAELPLSGVKVVELATIIAAPLGASYLADMGADVIKVEQIGGDPYRGMGGGIGSARVNAGKRSISVDLKSEAGREAVVALIAEADVVIHNFRPGVPERLGIGYEALAAINPGLVYLQSNGYGPDGPGALRPSTHPIPGAAMGGVMYQMGERVPTDLQDIEGLRLWTRRLMRANEVNPDPNTALVVATSVMLGLVARQNTGRGQQIFIDMFGANAYANSDDFLDYPDKAGRAMPDAELLGLSATYRLYQCAQEQWVFLAVPSGREQARLRAALASHEIAAPSAALLADGGSAAATALAELFAARTADEWEALLAPAGVGCVRADRLPPAEFWLEDKQANALGLTAAIDHPVWGQYRRHGRMVLFDEGGQPLGPPPIAGQHNAEILLQHGYSEAQVEVLQRDGVLWQEAAE